MERALDETLPTPRSARPSASRCGTSRTPVQARRGAGHGAGGTRLRRRLHGDAPEAGELDAGARRHGQGLGQRAAVQGHGRVPAAVRRLRLHDGVPDRRAVRRRPRAAHLRRHQRDHESDHLQSIGLYHPQPHAIEQKTFHHGDRRHHRRRPRRRLGLGLATVTAPGRRRREGGAIDLPSSDADAVDALGDGVSFVAADVTDEAAVTAAVDAAECPRHRCASRSTAPESATPVKTVGKNGAVPARRIQARHRRST